jgi:quinol monooxygenase YgiN
MENSMPVFILVEMQIKAEALDLAETALPQLVAEALQRSGAQKIVLLKQVNNPRGWVLWQRWDDLASYKAYLQYRDETGSADDFIAMLFGPPQIKAFSQLDFG